MIFQEPMTALNPLMRCGRQVTEAIRAHRKASRQQARRRTLELLKEVRLPYPEKAFHAFPHELSGGQRQRVMIAMAIACEPGILIADEPTTALDIVVRAGILSLLRELREKYGLAILFITHDLGMISGFADELLVMHEGRIVETGPVRQVFQRPAHPYTKNLLGFLGQGGKVRQDTGSGTGEPLLRTENLSVRFHQKDGKAFQAVRDVCLSVLPGEVLGLVGESGCGKTTLGRTLLRLKDPSAGSIIFQNLNITGLRGRKLKATRRDMQIVFQDPFSSLNPRMTIGTAITEPMKAHGIGMNNADRKEKALRLLDKTGLDRDFFHRYPHELSGGQRQRACIARALSVKPRFIVFDESVSALDVAVQAQILELLEELRKSFGLTYIFISHDLSVVRSFAHRIAVMKDGRIVEEASAGQLFLHPASDYTRQMIDALPMIH